MTADTRCTAWEARQHGREARRFCTASLLSVITVVAFGCTSGPIQEADTPGPGTDTPERAATPWEQARLSGVEFRAIGQEPGWNLDIDQGREIRYVGDYGNTRVTVPTPEPDIDSAGTIVYHAQTAAHDLRVVIRETPCQDTMSGEEFTHSVTVMVGGREVQGCGRVLMTGELTNTYWQLVSLGGAPVLGNSPQREPHIRLVETEQRVTGSTGCNLMFGQYALDGRRLRFSNLGSTRMACVDQALAQQEQRFTQMLELADSAGVARDTLTLFAGDRELARFRAVYPR